jgi:hypothetical protein
LGRALVHGEREHASHCLSKLDHLPAALAVTNVTVRRRQGEGKGAGALDCRPQFAADPWLAPPQRKPDQTGAGDRGEVILRWEHF